MNQTVIVGVAAASVGLAAGYFAGRKHAQLKYDRLMEEEIEQAKTFFSKLYKKEEYETPETAAEALGVDVNLDPAVEALRQYQGRVEVEAETPVEKVTEMTEVSEEDGVIEENVFVDDPLANLAIDDRHPDIPYIIATEEWMENEHSHNQIQVTWFEGDRIMVDERDDVIEDWRTLVGSDAVNRFGLGSGDDNVVMVRNERRNLDIEIARSNGRYGKQVAGFDDSALQHSDTRMRRRRQQWDE